MSQNVDVYGPCTINLLHVHPRYAQSAVPLWCATSRHVSLHGQLQLGLQACALGWLMAFRDVHNLSALMRKQSLLYCGQA